MYHRLTNLDYIPWIYYPQSRAKQSTGISTPFAKTTTRYDEKYITHPQCQVESNSLFDDELLCAEAAKKYIEQINKN